MRIRLLLDQGVPRESADRLRALGYECVHAAEAGMQEATDDQMLAFARSRDAALVTLDGSFQAALSASAALRPSVIRLRIRGLDGARVAGLVEQTAAAFAEDLEYGSLVTLKSRKTTCYKLPLGDPRELR